MIALTHLILNDGIAHLLVPAQATAFGRRPPPNAADATRRG